jgi:hypothetical protein
MTSGIQTSTWDALDRVELGAEGLIYGALDGTSLRA